LDNKQDYLNNVKKIIGKAIGWGEVQNAVDSIDSNYLLIPKFLFPKIRFKPFTGTAELDHITEDASKGNTTTMRELAYEYLAMADYVDNKKIEAENLKLNTQRWDAYNVLFPYQNMYTLETFNYDALDPVPKRAIEEIARLRAELDK
jgi:hypothetical protein